MACERWSDLLQSFTRELVSEMENFTHEALISVCITKKPALLKYIGKFENYPQKSVNIAWENMSKAELKNNMEPSERLFYYSQCLLYSPSDSNVVPLAYAQRSSVLESLNYCEESVNDVELALSSGYPQNQSLPLQVRKAKCLALLGEYDEAEAVLIDSLYRIQELHAEISESTERLRIEKEIFYIQEVKNNKGNNEVKRQRNVYRPPALKNGENPCFPSSSRSLSVVKSKETGRHVIANCDIEVGDVLFVERPFSFIISKPLCIHCCEETVAPIPCWNCVDVQFCTEKCRNNAWKSYHKFECGFYLMLQETGIGHLALRILFQAASNLKDLKKLIGEFLTKKEKGNPSLFSDIIYENIYNLQTHISCMERDDLFQYSMTATLLSLYVVHYTNYASITNENIEWCANILLRHITQLISNGHAISGFKFNNKRNNSAIISKNETGSAIYPSVSIMNHSCDPSVTHCFFQNCIVVLAIKDIKKGEEVFNSYGVHCKKMKRSERKELLKSQYFFDCNCKSCIRKYDTYDILNSFKCDQCGGPIVEESEANQLENHPSGIYLMCLNCYSVQRNAEEKYGTKFKITQLIEKGEYELNVENNASSALKAFTKAWVMGRNILYKFHEDLSYTADQIARCLFLLEDYKPGFMFLRGTVLATKGRWGSFSLELAFQSKRLGDLISVYASENNQPKPYENADDLLLTAIECYDMSEKIFSKMYGVDHPIVDEIKSKKSTLLGAVARESEFH